jgi:hypothetical protein
MLLRADAVDRVLDVLWLCGVAPLGKRGMRGRPLFMSILAACNRIFGSIYNR